ncbi:uncharacterized protein F5147DRAFT_814009 [Suillus discolor]|uniref:Uncharacterized protein n=1 Tax=Suillus discolor TaxID=1912936 RepID=A0A9P7EZW6_9AGAM|nr:uncharacterized protein F5147DRAFT_814009 [Suillus discolor]KAG2099584.1 hypothetical protein F5147DRAFT_814009 [Suillus discolor]
MSQTISAASRLLKREHLKGSLDTEVALAKKTLQKHPQLWEIIRHACQTRSFSHIADLELFQIPQASDPVQSSQDFLYDSFVRPYVGKAVDGFYEYLKKSNMKFRGGGMHRPYYAKFCSIVQSSGTGKSRLMIELRNKGVIVSYMNLRDPSDLGYPTRDLVPTRILTENTGCTPAEYTAHCCAFSTAIFQTLQQVLNNPNIKMPTPEEKTDVATAAKLRSTSLADRKIRSAKLRGESFVTTSYDNMPRVLQHLFTEEGNVSNDDLKLVIAFDEAHTLSNISGKGFLPSDIIGRAINCYSQKSDASVWVVFVSTTLQVAVPSDIIGRAINCYSQKSDASVWVVFVSTTLQVADFSAPQEIHDSMRLAVYGDLVYTSWFDHIVGFGHPLSVSMFLSLFAISLTAMNRWKSLAERLPVIDILRLAAQKLCKSTIFNPGDKNQALAVLSQRFGLNFCLGHPDATSHLSKAVVSHLRMLFLTTKDRMWNFTASEPLLSCVAAIILHRMPYDLSDALRVLNSKVDGGMVEIEQSGDFASRLLLLLAKDLFVRKDPPQRLDPASTL